MVNEIKIVRNKTIIGLKYSSMTKTKSLPKNVRNKTIIGLKYK